LKNCCRVAVALALTLWIAAPAYAELVRIEVLSRLPFQEGIRFGPAGPYEIVVGVAYFTLDPDDPANAAIVDLALAPRDAEGRVLFSADIQILRPVDPSLGNGTLLVEIVNRGNRGGVNAREAGAFGAMDVFAIERGFTLAWVGWQFDVASDLVGLTVPSAAGPEPVTGRLAHRITVPTPAETAVLPPAYPAHDPQGPGHTLEVRERIGAPFVPVPREQWSFARLENGVAVPDSGTVHLTGGFQPGPLYLLTYTSADPPVAGLGFASVRDFVSYAKHGGDPLVSSDRAIGFGYSQSGRYLRDFLRHGFNADEEGRAAFDGIIPIIAGAGGGYFNFRFAQPDVGASYGAEPMVNDRFPFAHLPQRDPFTGVEAGLLDRVATAGVTPKIFEVNASSEYDDRGAALVHTLADGSADAPVAETTRIYTLLGSPHGGDGDPEARPGSVAYANPNGSRFLIRALLVAMHEWISGGTEPPASRYPRIADGTLVPYRPEDFPEIPGISRPAQIYRVPAADFGADSERGILTFPPRLSGEYPVLVPALDEDGNERGGVRMPELAVPLATYTGWNLRRTPDGTDLQVLAGGYIPLPLDRRARQATGDPRPSIEERYANQGEYRRRYIAAARELIGARLLLAEDLSELMRIAGRRWAFHQADPAIIPEF
jgi:hypothetical protein